MERWRGWQKWLLPLNINIAILNSKLKSSIAWINPNLPICYNISKPQKFNMDYIFHRALLTDAHSKHILILLVIYSQNLRKFHEWFSEFEWDENRTQKRKSIRLLIKMVEFQQDEHFEAILNSISWVGGVTNEIMLFYLYNITKNMNPFSYHPKLH